VAHVPSHGLHELTQRLVVEYAGALPPGQVLVAVREAHRVLIHWTSPERRLEACEGIARRLLTERVAALASKATLAPAS
jgi:hypothetical protein